MGFSKLCSPQSSKAHCLERFEIILGTGIKVCRLFQTSSAKDPPNLRILHSFLRRIRISSNQLPSHGCNQQFQQEWLPFIPPPPSFPQQRQVETTTTGFPCLNVQMKGVMKTPTLQLSLSHVLFRHVPNGNSKKIQSYLLALIHTLERGHQVMITPFFFHTHHPLDLINVCMIWLTKCVAKSSLVNIHCEVWILIPW